MILKKFIIIILVFILCFIIFKYTFNSKVDYLALGDDLTIGKSPFGNYGKSFSDFFAQYLSNKNKLKSYNKKFSGQNYRITDLIKSMNNNKREVINNKKVNINQAIVNAELITISVGINDLFYKLNYRNIRKNQINTIYNYIYEMFIDYSYLLINIRKLNDCKIYLIGYYNPLINLNDEEKQKVDEIFEFIDKEFNNLESKNIFYVKIIEGFNNKSYYLPNNNEMFPSLEGYNYISTKLIESYEK